MTRLGLWPMGTRPLGYVPAWVDPPINQIQDLEIDLVAWIASKINLTPSPLVVPPGPALPVTLTYTLVSETPVMRLNGSAGLAQRVYQLDFRGTQVKNLSPVVESLRKALQGYRGVMGTNQIRQATWKRVPTGYDVALNRSPSGTIRQSVELGLWYLQPQA